jgi:hypothetical protein
VRHARRLFSLAVLFLLLFATLGCRSHGVSVTVNNDSGGNVRNLEVQYPGGSFGKSVLPHSGSYSYRVKILREGAIMIAFDGPDGKTHRSTGPTYSSNADGNLTATIDRQNTVTYSQR